MEKTIGFIGQGFIGKNYADDFEARGFKVVRYAAEPQYAAYKEKIKECDIVFIAVPTRTTPEGFDGRIVREVVKLVGEGKTAVIKSTVTPGTTESIQKENPGIFVFHSPEFLNEATAREDAAHPVRTIVGIPVISGEYRKKAEVIVGVLPKAPYTKICSAREAEIIKYARNTLGYVRVVFANILYDFAEKSGADWAVIREAISADPDNGPTYANALHKSGRGAGGRCFIKDFAAFAAMYEAAVGDPLGMEVIKSLEAKNIELLKTSNKDIDLLHGVYGDEI